VRTLVNTYLFRTVQSLIDRTASPAKKAGESLHLRQEDIMITENQAKSEKPFSRLLLLIAKTFRYSTSIAV